MIKIIPYKNTSVRYKTEGEGKTLVLLHGYMESLDIWEDLSKELSEKFHVLTIDLLGHGETGSISGIHTMEEMATLVNFVIEHEDISKCSVFGHSMGGYVTLAFAKQYFSKLNAFGLIHSHPFADPEDKKADRLKVVETIRQGGKDLMIEASIPNLYAKDRLFELGEKISVSKQIAKKMEPENIIAALMGMRERADYTSVIAGSKVPVYLIIGKKDNLIHWEKMVEFAQEVGVDYVVLEDSGHMGFFEEKEKTIESLMKFMS